MMEQNENNHSSNHGYVYILSNPGMPGLLKIGMTRFDPTRRVQELSSAEDTEKDAYFWKNE